MSKFRNCLNLTCYLTRYVASYVTYVLGNMLYIPDMLGDLLCNMLLFPDMLGNMLYNTLVFPDMLHNMLPNMSGIIYLLGNITTC